MLLIENVGHIGLMSLTDGHLGRHIEHFRTLNDARVASVGFIKYNASITRINKEKTLKSSSRSFWFSTVLNILYSFNRCMMHEEDERPPNESGSVECLTRDRGFEFDRRQCVVVLEQDTFILA